jgi:hypothetical protein
MTCSSLMRTSLATLAVCAFAAAASAQDYAITTYGNLSGNKYVAPPSSGTTRLTLGQDSTTSVTLPFDFPYFGAVYSSAWVCSNGFIQFGVSTPSPNNATAPANWSNASFPIQSSTELGIVAPYWDELGDPSVTGAVKTWASGTAPTRVFYVSWEGVAHYSVSAASSLTFQVQLYEGSGRIIFAYKQDSSTTTWGGGYFSNSATRSSYSMGLQSPPGDGRYSCYSTQNPSYPGYSLSGGTGSADYGRPPTDYQFDPRIVTYTGTVLYDRIVSDANGIGASAPQTGQVCALMPIEVRRADGSLGFKGTTDANGFFSIKTFALAATTSGSFNVLASCPAALVHTGSSTAATPFTFKSSQSFAGNTGTTTALGTITIGAAADSTGNGRAPLHIARLIQTTFEWVATRTTKPLGQLDVLYDTSSSLATVYVYPNVTNNLPAQLRVGSTGSSNPDAWDAFPIRREYGRHVLAAIAAAPTSTLGVDTRFDAVTNAENALAEAFGCYLHAAISKETQFTDGLTANTANVIAIEEPTLTSAKGIDVAGWVGAALFDLVDANNESWDWIDGTAGTAADRPFLAAATLTAPVTFSSFYTAWGTLGYDGLGLSRIAIHYGLLADDTSERNDAAAEASALGALGVRRDAQVLNIYNEDWFQVDVASAAPHLVADVSFDRLTLNTKLTLQIQDTTGTVLATGAGVGGSGPIRATSGAAPAGTYRVRVRHDSGVRIPAYAVQVYAPLAASSQPFVPWTVGRPYAVNLTASGGVPPYTLAVAPTYVKPAGLVLDSQNLRVTGTPVEAGQHYFVLQLSDSGQPANVWPFPIQFTVHDVFTFSYGPFVGFPLGRALKWPAPIHGGTRPFTVSVNSGALPSGITFDAAAVQFNGTADTPGPAKFGMDGIDVAGSADARTTTGVVCVPFTAAATPADLAADESACGWFFDAVAGSKASLSVKTAKGRAKRSLAAVVIGPDGSVVTGGKIRPGTGVASLTSVPCASSGRYYCIVSSASGDATQLLATVKLAPPVAAGAKVDLFAPGATQPIDFGALAGAVLTVKGTPDKASGLKVTVQALIDPDGRVLDLPTEMKLVPAGNGFSLTGTLAVSGTWRVIISALPGGTGRLTWSLKVKEPKGVAFDADSIPAK